MFTQVDPLHLRALMKFDFIEFRDSIVGRQAYIQGSSLAVWEVMLVARSYDDNLAAVARHLEWPEVKVQAAFNYASAFPDEIKDALAENDAMDFEALKRILPQIVKFPSEKDDA